MSKADNLTEVLQKKFHLQEFRPGQLEVIQSILAGQDVLCVMPTGYGKSLCYQLAALMLNGVTVVVSPLVALMKDQVDSLRAKGFQEVTFINSSVTVDEQRMRLQAMKTGRFKLVYISPERFRSRAFLHTLKAVRIALFVVDEGHCISQWGHDFRPDYLALKDAIAALGRPQVAAFTATATLEVRQDIKQELGILSAQEFLHSVGRESLEFFVLPVTGDEDKLLWIKHLVNSIGGKGIIYAGKRRDCEHINAFLRSVGVNSEYFHAGREEGEKKSIQERFMNDEHPQTLDVIAATNAFGLGVDKANIRFVIHSAIPGTVEEYFQEAGRAGRDSLRAFCILLYSYDDRSLQEWFIENSLVNKEELVKIYQTLSVFPSVGNFRVVDFEDFYWQLRLDETKIRVGISHLERLGLIRRLPDVDAQMSVQLLPGAKDATEQEFPVQDDGKARMERAILEQARSGERLELVSFCTRHHFEPLSVIETLYDLEFERVVHFHHGRRAMLLRIEKTPRSLQQMNPKEIGFEEYRQHKYQKLEKMLHYAESDACRVRYIREYFGEQVRRDCGCCDNCRARKGWRLSKRLTPVEKKAVSETAIPQTGVDYFDEQLLHRAILTTVRDVRSHAGKNTVADILKGSKAKTVMNWSFNKLTTYGKMPFFRKEALVEAIKTLILKGLIREQRPDDFDYPVVKLSEKGNVMLSEWDACGTRFNWPPEPKTLSENDDKIFQTLKRFRMKAADQKGIVPYQILHDSTLKEIAIMRPRNLSELAFIRGLSPARIDKYGMEILRALSVHLEASEVGRDRFSVHDISAVKKFVKGKQSRALPGDFDVGYALANHTEVQDGKRQYTPIGRMVYKFKYRGQKSHVEILTGEMVKFLVETGDFHRADLIVPVPSTIRDRDYNPVLCLAETLSQRSGLLMDKEALVKTRQTRPQKELVNLTQKQLNVKGAFKVTDKNRLKGKNILLIDDLYDSGATLNECTRVLKAAGARMVLVLTLTRTVHSL